MENPHNLLLSVTLLAGILLSACSKSEGVIPMPSVPQGVSASEIVNITWQWVELIENHPAGMSVVANPENYTLTFFNDGTFRIKADCNPGHGAYTVAGNKIKFSPMALTMMLCPPGSLHDQFLKLLGLKDTFGILDGKLVFVLKDGEGEMLFQNGGQAKKSNTMPNETTLYIGPDLVPSGHPDR